MSVINYPSTFIDFKTIEVPGLKSQEIISAEERCFRELAFFSADSENIFLALKHWACSSE